MGTEYASAFAATISPLFDAATETDSFTTSDGYETVRQIFPAGDKIAALDLTSDASGQIVEIELNFPTVDGECLGAPPADELARRATRATEPVLGREVKNMRLVGSLVALGWRRPSSSSPAVKVGRTIYSFHRLRYFCTMTIKQPPVPAHAA